MPRPGCQSPAAGTQLLSTGLRASPRPFPGRTLEKTGSWFCPGHTAQRPMNKDGGNRCKRPARGGGTRDPHRQQLLFTEAREAGHFWKVQARAKHRAEGVQAAAAERLTFGPTSAARRGGRDLCRRSVSARPDDHHRREPRGCALARDGRRRRPPRSTR